MKEQKKMANQEHLDLLLRGVESWNQWRVNNPGIIPNLLGAYLRGTDLSGADLRRADFQGADLRRRRSCRLASRAHRTPCSPPPSRTHLPLRCAGSRSR